MKIKSLVLLATVLLLFSSCTSTQKTMREPNAYIELGIDDFELSEQVTAEATSTKIIGIDWQRVFSQKKGNIEGGASMMISLASIPVMGNYLFDQTANYALYEMMMQNPDYDVVLYPQYETVTQKPILGIGWLTTITTVKAKARLGKLK